MTTGSTAAFTKMKEAHRQFWERQARLLAERMSDEALVRTAYEALQSEERRQVPVYWRNSVEQALEDAENVRRRFRVEMSVKGSEPVRNFVCEA